MEKKQYEIRPAYRNEWDEAINLTWKTFMEFEAKDYTEEGIESFHNFIFDTTLYRMFKLGVYQLFCALEGTKIVGVISLRSETHISLLFVDKEYHKQGIGKALIQYVCHYLLTEEGKDIITVNAAPYAIGFYHRCGFKDLREEEENDGIRYTPMQMKLK